MLYAQVIAKSRSRVEELTYSVPAQIIPFIKVGSLVTVPLKRRQVTGVIVGFSRGVAQILKDKLRPIIAVKKDREGLDEEQIKVIHHLSQESGASLAEVAFHALNVSQSVKARSTKSSKLVKTKPVFVQGSLEERLKFYDQIMRKISPRRQFLVLFAQHSFANLFKKMVTVGIKRTVVIGTIGQAFYPLHKGDFIIVDQPYHVGSISNQRPYLSTKQIACARSSVEGINLVLGDTLIGLDDYPRIQNGSWRLVERPFRVQPLFITDRRGSEELVMPTLAKYLKEIVSRKKRVLTLVLSRGWASALVCRHCGHIFNCPNCSRTTAVEDQNLRCRYCSYQMTWPTRCLRCRNTEFVAVGEGVTRFSAELQKVLPKTKIQQLSADNPRLETSNQLVVATEKIFSFPDAKFDETVILSADRMLSGAKLNGIGQLLAHLLELQTSGQQISVQTYFPDHPVWSFAATANTSAYYQMALKSRQKLHLPPFGTLIVLAGQARNTTPLFQEAKTLTAKLRRIVPRADISYPEITDRVGRSYQAEISVFVTGRLSNKNRKLIAKALSPSWAIRQT